MHRLNNSNQRLAKRIARSGLSSRREAEKYVADGRVTVNGKKITQLSFLTSDVDKIAVDGKPIKPQEKVRLWKFNKPKGFITSHRDERDRPTVFDILPTNLPRLISIGRLDFNSEGLLLLTNDGTLKRTLELPSSRILRTYEVRARGLVTDYKLQALRSGLTVRGTNYLPMEVRVMRKASSNAWFQVGLLEGKNREIRLSFEAVGLEVNRLIRKTFGPFNLGDLRRGEVIETKTDNLLRSLKELNI